MKESVLVTNMIELIRTRGGYAENIWGGGFQSAGIPDILACYKGVFLGIEVKVGKNKPSALQKAKVKLINQAGGLAVVTWDDTEQLKAMLDYIDHKAGGHKSVLDATIR